MKDLYIKDLKKDTQLSGETFAVLKIKKNLTKSGSEYFRIEVGDKTGSVSGNIWEDSIPNCEMNSLEQGDIAKIWGKVEEYKGAKQIKIISLGKTDEYNLEDFVAVSKKDPEQMWKEFNAHIESIPDENLKNLVTNIFSKDNLGLSFQNHPGAQRLHHAFKYGLLEHIMEMLDISVVVSKYYPEADISLIKTGIMLHDIGKLLEIKDNQTNYERTVEGNLLGHLVQGYEILLDFVEPDFPKDLLLKLKHIILSHNGVLEFGSPVMPMTLEAIIVSEIDDLSAKARQYLRILEENKENDADFSERDFAIGTSVYLK